LKDALSSHRTLERENAKKKLKEFMSSIVVPNQDSSIQKVNKAFVRSFTNPRSPTLPRKVRSAPSPSRSPKFRAKNKKSVRKSRVKKSKKSKKSSKKSKKSK
jgi:hypothetical protein